MFICKQSTFGRSTLVTATAFALVISQTAPALAYGPSNAFGGYNDVRAMGYFRIPLGSSQADTSPTKFAGILALPQNRLLQQYLPETATNSGP